MGKDKVDLRILKTRKAIKEAFLTLVQTKGYERITIQDIADEAVINRNTFYLHYVDKPDLMENLCQESMKELNNCFNLDIKDKDIHAIDKEAFILSLREMFKAIEGNIVFFRTMLSQSGQTNFSTYLKEALKDFILSGSGDHYQNQKMKVGLEYMISGLVGVICMWISDPEHLVAEEVIGHLSEIHFKNVLDLLENI
ncbi:TetR/AcrR family transcriptional regulator [Paenibacillus harenae]|uniref:TetR/AcrR family transcriptional regulator n=1 Tax=Paenibacillus harenae TaxID=306543 RepID=UPI002794D686|nr:TetR/AcrR family transcriptional regulator [Paenibacillus harenae]MDQ0058961.1 AcrR family transcriptional regulator [Paenibacillus harenae]